jgi:hypothetical protein
MSEKRKSMSLGGAISEAIDQRVESEVAGRTGSVDPTSRGARVPIGGSAPSGEKLVVSEGVDASGNESGPNPDYVPGTESPGTSAGTSSPEQTEASGQTAEGRPGDPPQPPK